MPSQSMMTLVSIPTLPALREKRGGEGAKNLKTGKLKIPSRGQRAAGEGEGEGAADGEGGEAPAQGMDTD